MEELFFRLFLACDKLDIVYKQRVSSAIFVVKLFYGVICNGMKKLVCKSLGGNIDYIYAAAKAKLFEGPTIKLSNV